MIAPARDSSSCSEESDPIDLPRETIVSVGGIHTAAPTHLLTRCSPYWQGRVLDHARAIHAATQQQPAALSAPTPSPPIVLDETGRGLVITSYEFVVYVGLLQAEEYMRTSLSMGLPPPMPVHGPMFRSFAPAGLPTPSTKTLNNVSRMATFFGRGDLARQIPVQRAQLVEIDYSAPTYVAVQRQLEDTIFLEMARHMREEERTRANVLFGDHDNNGDEDQNQDKDKESGDEDEGKAEDVIMTEAEPRVAMTTTATATTATTATTSSATRTVTSPFPMESPIILPPMLSPLPSYILETSSFGPGPGHIQPLPTMEPAVSLSPPTTGLLRTVPPPSMTRTTTPTPSPTSVQQPQSHFERWAGRGMLPPPSPSSTLPNFRTFRAAVPSPEPAATGVGRGHGRGRGGSGSASGSSPFVQRQSGSAAADRRHHPYQLSTHRSSVQDDTSGSSEQRVRDNGSQAAKKRRRNIEGRRVIEGRARQVLQTETAEDEEFQQRGQQRGRQRVRQPVRQQRRGRTGVYRGKGKGEKIGEENKDEYEEGEEDKEE